jgi:hypothetical protein
VLEDRLEEEFSGIRLSRSMRVDDSKNRQRSLVQIPIMAKLSREGTVALGDVYAPCIALGGLRMPGKPRLDIDILVLDAEGGVAAVECRLNGRGVHAWGAKKLEQVVRRLGRVKSRRSLSNIYRKHVSGRHPGESIADLAAAHWEDVGDFSVERAIEQWVESMASGNVAVYLATERRDSDRPSAQSDSLGPMQELLSERGGGVLQVQLGTSRARPHGAYIEALDEPARLIWAYRRLVNA